MWFLQFCEANLALLITLMTRAPDSSTRANIIISLGDMAARLPNTVEPLSEHMYAALKDKDTTTRKNALMVKVHEDDFRLLTGADRITEYRFHTRTARHFFCQVCGIYPFHRKRVTPDFVGVNVFCLEDFDPTGIPVRATVGRGMA